MSLLLLAVFAFANTACSDDDESQANYGKTKEFVVSKSEMTFFSEGGTAVLSVKAPSAPQVAASESWLNVAPKSSSAVTYNYEVTAAEYNGVEGRTATINVTVAGETKTVTVTQLSADGITITSGKESTIGAEGGIVNIKVAANGKYSVKINNEWISNSLTTAKTRAMEETTHAFVVAKNAGSERKGTISFILDDITVTATITQEGAQMGNITSDAKTIAKNMYPGWNLGNTMEASGNNLAAETAWQSTKTTQQLLDYVKSQGFKSVRIPCSWMQHASDGKIDAQWMARVKEVVNYCIAADLYVMLNDHYDGGWIEVLGFSKSASAYEKVDENDITAKIADLKNIWTQIAEEFKDYDEHLLFAGMNEPFQQYDLFHNHHQELTPILNRYNQAFVEAVRATGGNNSQRALVVQGPSVNIASTTNAAYGFTMPDDAAQDALMVEVHYYDPWDFCGGSGVYYWGKANHHTENNASFGEEDWVKSQFQLMKTNFVDKGYPVIVGECGANWKDLSGVSGASQDKHNASIKSFFYETSKQAVDNGLVLMVWDINATNQNGTNGTMTILNRGNLSVFCPYAMDGIKEGNAAGAWPY